MNFFVSGRDYEIKNFNIGTTDTTISFNSPVKAVVMQVRGNRDVQFRRNTVDTPFFTIFGSSALDKELVFSFTTNIATIGFARVSQGTEILEVLAIF